MPTPDSSSEPASAGAWDTYNTQLAGLIERCRHGDVHAFEELYVSTVRWMLARVRRIVDDGQAEDVLADVYVQVWKSMDTFDARRAPPASWLATIARSRALDHLRRERRRQGEVSDSPAPEAWNEDGPEQMLSRAQDAKLVQLSLATLDEQERLVLGLAYFHDRTQPEISALTGFPLGTVKSLVHRAQQKLRKCFKPVAAHPASSEVRV